MNLLNQPLEEFLQRLTSQLAEERVDVSRYEMDHVCYRVDSLTRYEMLAHAWRLYASDTHESLVGGRPISVFVLDRPLFRLGRSIAVLELPAPKKGSPYPEGWEHAEFVIDEPFETFMARHSHLVFDIKSIGKELNPELGLKLGHGLQVKFHHQPLARIIQIEREKGLALPNRSALD
ncbi:VOC family protein [Candidatus Uhrbacteria bacterium]|nr:VOC family protein [Candidatus Uhrbacteria bacterium]